MSTVYSITDKQYLLQRKRTRALKEGWEYAGIGSSSFHIMESQLDFTRRRRFVRKLINEKPGAKAVFRFIDEKEKDGDGSHTYKQQVPHMYMTFKGETAFVF